MAVLRPVPAVLAVMPRGSEVLLVQRRNPPDAGFWGFPGGKVDFGETLHAAAERELREETGVTARALRVLTALDVIGPGPAPDHHFVLIAVLCEWQAGAPLAADDAQDARWVALSDLEDLTLSKDVAEVARLAAGGGL
ncbi:NUDIX hydrolase [Allosediminivita pacifica]|uniref:8-oxo-dGTP diphosphatase n=1 Tax=Allosediminivita pacifica TaxID=1267769 RepID=A0A2T6A6G7_9RHOB|nr:NUDIX hydrolase [Allosediminivita pacifica]PTX39427.1 8-oxo-dGTP diphosphatase [Allosediminivita pacifica]GGB27748.1 hypothetical protein GCM10011324_41840 [Allosediminivita pacifica]